ncbi:SEC-C domain-containing protein [Clostridium sp. D2Q-14]|uniref:SEC-C metal-binding domain-containing protein n=1 Tax=Anaeromonas gelatinilytica TaxID=2683194 RepID=UPI00193B851B|nr:SEC-C metal-binding domain-containing protein [Anaeromonas gelatinilytica]MBS4534663.1 SEC-C domain-containing protein [Anaeromonas gelatinilytica]
MGLYQEWTNLVESNSTPEQYEIFWKKYLPLEQKIYEAILSNHTNIIENSIKELSNTYKVDPIIFTGFLDGINASLKNEIDLNSLEEDSIVKLDIDFEKLFYNMHEAKAKWLYKLLQWEDVLSKEDRKRIKKEYDKTVIVVKKNKVGRNDPCPCGSGKKYKKCCLNK